MKSFSILEKTLIEFLNGRCSTSQPILIALSGGPDSLALFYAAIKVKEELKLDIGIAHVDHGWREESAEEARQLEHLALDLKLPFHLKKLDPVLLKGNLEEACRIERIRFFKELCQNYNYQAVMLGHHADDQAETVLKKILEGANLSSLQGICQETVIEGVKIWRPWLSTPKKTLLDWLNSYNLKAFEDQTNSDPRFLRAKFRTQIIPSLSADFGKEVRPSLCRLSVEARELNLYLQEKIEPYFNSRVQGIFGTFIDLGDASIIPKLEVKTLIRALCKSEGFFLSYELIENAAEWLGSKKADMMIRMGERLIYIDRGRIFIPCQEIPLIPSEQKLTVGMYGPWKISLSENVNTLKQERMDWKMAWKGVLTASLPKGNYTIGPPRTDAKFRGTTSLAKWWSNHKIPAWLRAHVPVIWQNEEVVAEFLTGSSSRVLERDALHIEICFIDKM